MIFCYKKYTGNSNQYLRGIVNLGPFEHTSDWQNQFTPHSDVCVVINLMMLPENDSS